MARRPALVLLALAAAVSLTQAPVPAGPAARAETLPEELPDVAEICGDALPADAEPGDLRAVRLYFHSDPLPYVPSIANGGHDDSVHPMDRNRPTAAQPDRWYTTGGSSTRSNYLLPGFEAPLSDRDRVVCAATSFTADAPSFATDVVADASLYLDDSFEPAVTSLPVGDDGFVLTTTTRGIRLRFPAMDLAGDELSIQIGLPGPLAHLQYDGQIEDSHLDLVLRR